MQLTWLEDYLALADMLSFSKAAEARHITQPAFSRRIRALEAWVGTPLFARTTHAVALTAAGAHFHSHAEVLTRALQQLRRDTLAVSGRSAGPLSIAATHALSFTFFPKWVRGSDRILALGTLNLISDSMQACERMMLRGDVPFLLCHHHPSVGSKLEDGQFKSIAVGADSLVPLSAPDGQGAPRWTVTGRRPVPYLAYSPESGLGRIVAALSGSGGRAFDRDTVLTSHLAAALLTMARAGHGVAWLPRTLADEDMAAGALVDADQPDLAIPVEICLFRPAAPQRDGVEAVWAAIAHG